MINAFKNGQNIKNYVLIVRKISENINFMYLMHKNFYSKFLII